MAVICNGHYDDFEVSDFDTKRNLIVNYLPPTLNQDDVKQIFSKVGTVSNCKLIRNYTTGQSLGYAFIEYPTEELALEAISSLDGMQIQEKKLKVSYARQSSPDIKNSNVYVAGLPGWVTEEKLLNLFSPYGSVLTHKLLVNTDNTSRGVGFVRYGLKSEAEKAIDAMGGATLRDASGPLTVKIAIPPASKQNAAMGLDSITTNSMSTLAIGEERSNSNLIGSRSNHLAPSNIKLLNISSNSGVIPAVCVYVYGLQPTHNELTLYKLFAPFGAVLNVKLIRDLTKEDRPCKGYGFVNFAKYEDAHTAVASMNNVPFEEKFLQVSFKQSKIDMKPTPPPTQSYFEK